MSWEPSDELVTLCAKAVYGGPNAELRDTNAAYETLKAAVESGELVPRHNCFDEITIMASRAEFIPMPYDEDGDAATRNATEEK